MPNEQRRIDGSRLAGTTNGLEAGVPQLTDCGPFLSGRPIGSTESRQHGARVRRQIRAEPRQRGGFFQDPRELVAGRGRNAVENDRSPQIEAVPAPATSCGVSAQLFLRKFHVAGEDPARGQLSR
jgi:hypothetical protein